MAMQWPWPRCVEMIRSPCVERAADADRDRLLADVAMHDAVDLAGEVVGRGALLEAADRQHLAQHLALLVGRQVRRQARHGRASCKPVRAAMMSEGEKADNCRPAPVVSRRLEAD